MIGKPAYPAPRGQSNGSRPAHLMPPAPHATIPPTAACSPRLLKYMLRSPRRAICGRADNRRRGNRRSLRKPPIRSRSALRNASVDPRPNSDTPNKRRHQRAGREFGRDRERFEAARPVVRFGSIQAGDQPDALGPPAARSRRADIARRHADIAVVDDQDRMASLLGQIDQRSDLDVGSWTWRTTPGGWDRAGNSRINRSTSARAGSSRARIPNKISNSGYCCSACVRIAS